MLIFKNGLFFTFNVCAHLGFESEDGVSDGRQVFSRDELLQHFIKVTVRRQKQQHLSTKVPERDTATTA